LSGRRLCAALQAVINGTSDGFSLRRDSESGETGYGTSILVVTAPEATYTRAALTSVGEAIAYQLDAQVRKAPVAC
jgi:hypothetical protein